MDPHADATGQLTGTIPGQSAPDGFAFCIHASGRRFHVTFDLASVFMRQARRVIDADSTELVPLLHQDGFDMVFISPGTPLEIHDLRDECNP